MPFSDEGEEGATRAIHKTRTSEKARLVPKKYTRRRGTAQRERARGGHEDALGAGGRRARWAHRARQATAAVSAAVRGTLAWMRSPAGAVLVLLVLQSTSIVLLMRHSKTMVRAPGTGPAYPSSVAIFLAELLKMPLCLGMAAWTMHGDGG